jgi:membrane-associated phospholipid phosphatase
MNEHESTLGAPDAPDNLNPGKRDFLKLMGGASIGLGLGLPGLAQAAQAQLGCASSGIAGANVRRNTAYQARLSAAQAQRDAFECSNFPNGDEASLPANINSFSKGLAHNELGEVSPSAYQTLVFALNNNSRSALATVTMGTTPGTRLIAPFQGFAYSLTGPDPQGVPCPPPPNFSSAEAAAEMVECYWLALTRDVPFAAYGTDPMIAAACADLNTQPGYRGPRSAGQVTPANVFRGNFPGELDGPYLSQFLVRPIPHGPYEHEQRLRPFVAGNNFQVTYADWLLAQRGGGAGPTPVESTSVFQRNGRDLSTYLLSDYGAQPALEAALILNRLAAPANPGLPVLAPNEAGVIGGFNQFVQLLGGAQGPAIAACFYQKWQVHRRARPDAYSGRVHNHLSGRANYPIPAELLNSAALAATFSRYGNYLLPMAYKVGNPTHPSYPAGHASSVGSTVTVLKALYRGDFVLTGNKVAAADGLSLLDYAGPLTVEGELNKLAANIALGRDTAGVHYRSDGVEGLLQGERVALAFLAELRQTLPVSFAGFTLRTFSGVQVTV